MADIFISYKREERRTAERLSIALEQLGFDVWWDFDLMSGDRFRNTIRAVIDQCPAAIVLWSARAIDSDFVMDEAGYAKSKGKLCPARLDQVELPFGFGQVHTDDLSDWDGELSHPGFQGLVRALESRIGRKARLGSVRRDAEGQAQAAELDAFKAAQLANNQSALSAFLKDYPRGMFAGFVRGQLESMRVEAPAAVGGAPSPRAGLADLGDGGGASARPTAARGEPSRSESTQEPAKKAPPYAIFAGVALVAVAAAYVFLNKPQPETTKTEDVAAVVATPPPPAPANPEMSASDRAEIASLREQLAALAAQQQAALAAQRQPAQPQAQQQAPIQQTAPVQPVQQAAPGGFNASQLAASLRAVVESARASETRAVTAATRGREAAQLGDQSRAVTPSSGYGVFDGTDTYAGDHYAGGFVGGSRSGYGVYKYGSRSTTASHCEGQYATGQRNGSVVCYYRSGARFSGDYKNGDRSGFGVYRFADGGRDEGEYAAGKFNGYGVSWTADGRILKAGVWKDGVLATPIGPQGQ